MWMTYRFMLAQKENGESKFTKQEAKSNGQIQGGLESFIASEFEDIASFLGLEIRNYPILTDDPCPERMDIPRLAGRERR